MKTLTREPWTEFFIDENTNFPKFPRLLDSLEVYKAPYGLGVRFVGGPQPITIRGQRANDIFSALKELLNGKNGWREIVDQMALAFSIDEVTYVLTALHANSLLRDGLKSKQVQSPQTTYYERVRGKTGFNENGQAVERIIASSKVLVISTGLIQKVLVEHLSWSGYKNVSLCTPDVAKDFTEVSGITKVHNLPTKGCKAVKSRLEELIRHHRFVLVALPNPADWLISLINRIGIAENVQLFFFKKDRENFHIGPYVIPKRTACTFCQKMRANSYTNTAAMDNAYQDSLTEAETIVGPSPAGEDYISTQTAVTFFLAEVSKAITGVANHSLSDGAVTYDPLEGAFTQQKFARIPGCPECG